jgi:transposase InsO family protein
LAYVEVHTDEKAATAIGVLRRAVTWYAGHARLYTSETQRRTALPSWLHFYNHRPHSAIGGQPPITRVTNLPGHRS